MARSNSSKQLTAEEIAAATPEELVKAFMPLAKSLAHQWNPYNADTLSDAYVGLVKAAQKYQTDKGPFAPYAVLWMKQTLTRGSGTQNNIYLPPLVNNDLRKVLAAKNSLPEGASNEEIAQEAGAGFDEEDVALLLAIPRSVAFQKSSSWNDVSASDIEAEILSAHYDTYEFESVKAELLEALERFDLPTDLHKQIEEMCKNESYEPDIDQLEKILKSWANKELLL